MAFELKRFKARCNNEDYEDVEDVEDVQPDQIDYC